MGAKGQKPTIPEDRVIQEIKEKAYRRGWNERKEFDSGLIEEALRKSQNYEEFSLILRERIAKEDGAEDNGQN